MEIAGFYSSSADLEILDDAIFLQQYDWAVDEILASVFCDERQSQVEENHRPLKQLRTSPHFSFFSATNCTSKTTPDRILAERNRREKLSHRFVALSSLLPRLKKMDKASILREAIKHITQLQEKVETIEKKIATTKKCNDVVKSSCSNQSLFRTDGSLPQIEARICNSEVLIVIHNERRSKGVVEKVVGEIEKHHLSVVSCSFVPFGASQLNITIIAKIEEEFGLRMEEVVNKLHAALEI